MEEIIKKLAETNEGDYNLLKCAEECTELSEVLLKKVLKRGGPKEPTVQMIIEEIGDVVLRCMILSHALGVNVSGQVHKRIDYKLEKYKQYLEEGKYKGQI